MVQYVAAVILIRKYVYESFNSNWLIWGPKHFPWEQMPDGANDNLWAKISAGCNEDEIEGGDSCMQSP